MKTAKGFILSNIRYMYDVLSTKLNPLNTKSICLEIVHQMLGWFHNINFMTINTDDFFQHAFILQRCTQIVIQKVKIPSKCVLSAYYSPWSYCNCKTYFKSVGLKLQEVKLHQQY